MVTNAAPSVTEENVLLMTHVTGFARNSDRIARPPE